MDKLTAIVAILAICLILLCALKAGIDGLILTGGVAAIAGLGGFVTGTIKRNKKPPEKEK